MKHEPMNLSTVFCLETTVDSICPGKWRELQPVLVLLCLLALHNLLKVVDLERGKQHTVPTPLFSLCFPQPGSAPGDWQGFN